MLETPVAFLIFNRPELTRRVFAAIRAARPRTLLIVADGPRSDRPDDVENCAATRAVVGQVDWECDVRTDFSDSNLGCGLRVSSGVDWVFSQVEEAILLEDDCLPATDFFAFCETMLIRYRDDQRVMHICGSNFLAGQVRGPYSYLFSKYPQVWGWATWRRAWQHYDLSMGAWSVLKKGGWLPDLCDSPAEEYYWGGVFDKIAVSCPPPTWDYSWTFCCWIRRGMAVTPVVNLVSNLGTGFDATHTAGLTEVTHLPLHELPRPILHPPFLVRDRNHDMYLFDHFYPGRFLRKASMLRRIARALRGATRRVLTANSWNAF